MRFGALGGLILLAACSEGPSCPGGGNPAKPFYTAGIASTCYIDNSGDLYCLGYLTNIYFGTPAGPVPRKQNLPGKVSAASVTNGNVCAVVERKVYCRGNNDWGELGTGVVGPTESYQENYTPIQSTVAFDSIVVGNNAACSLSTAGKAYCWGANDGGQLGIGITSRHEATPKPVAGDLTFRSITGGSAGGFCALTTDGTPYCWGFFFDFVEGSSNAPRKLRTDVKFATLSLSGTNGCGLDAAGVLYCWGRVSFGQLGVEAMERGEISAPEQMTTPLRFKAVAALLNSVCAIAIDGTAQCRGYGTFGIFGNGERRQDETAFQQASTSARFVSISGTAQHVCAMTAMSEVYCWGRNDWGMTGEAPTAQPPNANTVLPRVLVDL